MTAHRDADGLYVLTPAGWRLNFTGGADADVTFAGRTTPMHGVLVEDEASVAADLPGPDHRARPARAARQIGLKFPAGRLPTFDEVTELVRREHFGVVRLSGKT